MRTFSGTVRSGRGDFAQYIARFGGAYAATCGVTLYPGTLNVEIDREWRVPAGVPKLTPDDYDGQVVVYVVPCLFMGEPAFVLRTEANERGDGDHPRTIVEVASARRLRDAFGLIDGSPVELALPGTPSAPAR